MRKATQDRLERTVFPALGLVGALAAWQLIVWGSGTRLFPAPSRVAVALTELVSSGALLANVRASMLRVFVGYVGAALIGVPLGLVMGRRPAVATAVNPLIQLLRPISPIAWIPISILLFGSNEGGPFFLVFLGAFFPIVVSSMNAVRNVEQIFIRAGLNFGLSERDLLWRVILPGALPQLVTGLRIGLGIAWLVLVAAEMVAVTSGLGYMVLDARNAGQRYDLVVAGMIIIGVIGLGLDTALRRVEGLRPLRWGFRQGT